MTACEAGNSPQTMAAQTRSGHSNSADASLGFTAARPSRYIERESAHVPLGFPHRNDRLPRARLWQMHRLNEFGVLQHSHLQSVHDAHLGRRMRHRAVGKLHFAQQPVGSGVCREGVENRVVLIAQACEKMKLSLESGNIIVAEVHYFQQLPPMLAGVLQPEVPMDRPISMRRSTTTNPSSAHCRTDPNNGLVAPDHIARARRCAVGSLRSRNDRLADRISCRRSAPPAESIAGSSTSFVFQPIRSRNVRRSWLGRA